MNYVAVLFKKPLKFRDFGADYNPEWANLLNKNIKKWSPDSTLTIVTDFDSGFDSDIIVKPFVFNDSGWAKMMEAYNPEIVGERSVLIGLDNIFIGDITSEIEKFDFDFITTKDPYQKNSMSNAFVSISNSYASELWGKWSKNRAQYLKEKKFHLKGQWSEMFWLRTHVKSDKKYWDDLIPSNISSYKVEFSKHKNPNTKFVYFHGNPKQPELKDQDWVNENWFNIEEPYTSHETAIIESDDIGSNTKIWAYSHISKGVKIGKNCMIGEGVHIGSGVSIGDNCKIQNHSLIYEGVTLEDNVFLGPNTITTNDIYPSVHGDYKKEGRFKETLFKNGSSVGANSTILCGVTLNENCMVGAGSVITKDVPKDSLVYSVTQHVTKPRP